MTIPHFCAPIFVAVLVCIGLQGPLPAQEQFFAPDRIELNDGTIVRGLIVRNTVDTVVLQTKTQEVAYPKSEISRIYDEDNKATIFTRSLKPGSLPPWRVIANDLRSHDTIYSVVEIPAARIEEGPFANIPYLSFRINRSLEANIFGNPDDPVALEVGIYGGRKNDRRLQSVLRSYMAGYLVRREDLAALYSLDLKGGQAQAGNLIIEISPPSDPSSFGTWWLRFYRKDGLARERTSDARYAAMTVPSADIQSRQGRLPEKSLGGRISTEIDRLRQDALRVPVDISRTAQGYVGGFFRDEEGNFRLLPFGGRADPG